MGFKNILPALLRNQRGMTCLSKANERRERKKERKRPFPRRSEDACTQRRHVPLYRLQDAAGLEFQENNTLGCFFCEHICFPHITKGSILLLIMGCYYALLIFGKDAFFRKINLDSSIFQATIPSVQA